MNIKSKAEILGFVTGAVVLAARLIKGLDVTFVLAVISLTSFIVAGVAKIIEMKGAKK